MQNESKVILIVKEKLLKIRLLLNLLKSPLFLAFIEAFIQLIFIFGSQTWKLVDFDSFLRGGEFISFSGLFFLIIGKEGDFKFELSLSIDGLKFFISDDVKE